jgi:hypothetical protein
MRLESEKPCFSNAFTILSNLLTLVIKYIKGRSGGEKGAI